MQSASVYRPILQKAWKTTWRHKRLWFFGVLAGLLNTGSIVDVTFRAFKQTTIHFDWYSLTEGSIPGASTILLYGQKLMTVSPTRLEVTVTLILLGLLSLGALALLGQATLIKAIPQADSKRKSFRFFRHAPYLLLHLLSLDILVRLLMIGLSLLTSAGLTLLHSSSFGANLIVHYAVLLLFIPSALTIGYLAFFGAVEVTLKNKDAFTALIDAANVLKKHWLSICELMVILFFVSFVISAAAVASVLLLVVPYLLMLTMATLTQSGVLSLATTVIGSALFAFTILTYFGFTTTFLYAAWYHAYARFDSKKITHPKLERVIRHLSKRTR